MCNFLKLAGSALKGLLSKTIKSANLPGDNSPRKVSAIAALATPLLKAWKACQTEMDS